ncbi:hypothetical protein C8U37_10898 [Trichococcus patagoniensis]|uniref:Uncharacterized protein n=1 Tax=Trichococcus patagoniensis TaxID=382641 RepID=A0A2T5IL62_9LACT|nr:hypothetical protein C8U37_10898 [Trichococcus patagoniensis]
MNQQDCKVWCFARFFISFISKLILPLFNAYPSFIQHPSITRTREIGEIISKANLNFPRSFFGSIKNKKHDHREGSWIMFFDLRTGNGREYENTSSFSNPTLDFIFPIGYY